MEPDAALGIAAQIAVALAGFSGVVTAFRSQSVHEWEPVDKLRLRLLLINSVLPLAFCLFALALLAIKPVPLQIWRWCSGVLLAGIIPFLDNARRQFSSLASAELRSGQANRGVFVFFAGLGSLSLLLQLYNVAVLDAFWAFFVGIAVPLLAALFQFMLMILRPPTDKK